jgi:hypothetical protein
MIFNFNAKKKLFQKYPPNNANCRLKCYQATSCQKYQIEGDNGIYNLSVIMTHNLHKALSSSNIMKISDIFAVKMNISCWGYTRIAPECVCV